MQNSGIRTDSIQDVVRNIQKSIYIDKIDKNEEFFSVDAVKLYDNLSKDLLKKCIRANYNLIEATGRTIQLKAIEACIDICYDDGVEFRGQIYRQKVGAPTGHPISSMAQNVVLSHLEKTIIVPMVKNNKIRNYHRWVDDILIRTESKNVDRILKLINQFDDKLQFTIERPENLNNYQQINFLDFSVVWNENVQFTKVFRKPSASKVVMPWNGFGPESWKTGTLIFYIRRAVTHSSTHQLMHTELKVVKDQFGLMGYPKRVIDSKIKKTLDKMFGTKTDQSEDSKEPKWVAAHLPWAGRTAAKIATQIGKIIPRNCPIKLSSAYKTSKLRDLLPSFRTKHKSPRPDNYNKLRCSDIVYKYICQCGQMYIGETKRRLVIRAKEHGQKGSPLMEHLTACGEKFCMDNFDVVAKRLYGRESRKRYETLYIRY